MYNKSRFLEEDHCEGRSICRTYVMELNIGEVFEKQQDILDNEAGILSLVEAKNWIPLDQ